MKEKMKIQTTAIQELVSSLSKNGIININQTLIDRCIKLEKEQICKAYLEGLSSILEHRDEEDYYKETYEK